MQLTIKTNSSKKAKYKRIMIISCLIFAYGLFLLPYVLTIPFLFHVPMIFPWSQLFRPHLFFSALDRANYCHLNFGGGFGHLCFWKFFLAPLFHMRLVWADNDNYCLYNNCFVIFILAYFIYL